MIGERLQRARAAAGLSMRGLADQVGVSANMIKKYEHDQSMPSSTVLMALARALNVRSAFLLRPSVVTMEQVEYRKKAATSRKVLKKVEVEVLDKLERWHELECLWPNFPVPAFEFSADLPEVRSLDDGSGDIENLTRAVRCHWALGLSPVSNLTGLLESKGIQVIFSDVGHGHQVDGLQAQAGQRPIVVVSSDRPGDRQRFTLAHELGHLLLRNRLPAGLDEEKACNQFASAFLLPASGLFQVLGTKRTGLFVRELLQLKHQYGLSMQACLCRAAHLGVITPAGKQSIFRELSRRGWRKQEPGPAYPGEKSGLFRSLVYRALGEGLVSESRAAELLAVTQYQLLADLAVRGDDRED